MSLHTLEQLYGELKARTKTAADITSEDIEGQDPSSLPGSENDKKAPEEAKKPDPEVKDETVGGAENYSGEGASAGSDNPKLEPQLLEADEPVLTPEKKPLDSTDVDAKTASAGNDLVSFILNNQKKELEAKKAAAPAKKAETAAPAPAAPAKKEAAQTDDIVLSNNVMAKIAAVILSRQEGRDMTQRILAEVAGEDFAKQAMDSLGLVGRQANARAAEMTEFEKGAQDAAAMLGDADEAQGAADAEAAIGDAEEAQGAADAEAALGDAAEAQGAADADAALAGEGDDEYTEEEVLEAIQELVNDGEITEDQAAELLGGADVPEEGAGDEEVTEEDLANTIVDMIDSGELSEEDAQALVAELAGAGSPEDEAALEGAVADAGEGAPDDGAAEEEAPTEDEPSAEEEAKTAAARDLVRGLVEKLRVKQAEAKKAKVKAPAKAPAKKAPAKK